MRIILMRNNQHKTLSSTLNFNIAVLVWCVWGGVLDLICKIISFGPIKARLGAQLAILGGGYGQSHIISHNMTMTLDTGPLSLSLNLSL